MRGVLVLVVFLLFISTATAQTKTEKSQPRPGTVRVAMVNVAVVFHKYEKAQAFKQEVETALAPFKGKVQKLTEEVHEWQKALDQRDFKQTTEETLLASIKKNQGELGDVELKIKRLLGQKQEENLVLLWKEVHCGIRQYAAEHGIELVLGYGDSMDREMLELFPNVSRKMHALESGSIIPLFMTQRVDIGNAVATRLNREYREKQAKEKIDLE